MNYIENGTSFVVTLLLCHSYLFGNIISGNDTTGGKIKHLEEQLYNHLKEEYPGAFIIEGHYPNRQSYTLSNFKRRRDLNKELLAEINKIDPKILNKEQRIDLQILKDFVKTFVKGYRWIMYGALTPLNSLEGISTRYLEQIPVQIYEKISLMRKAIKLQRTNYRSSMENVIDRLQQDIDIQLSPFLSQTNSSYDFNLYTDKSILRQIQMAYEAFVELKSFLINEYLPATRSKPGVHSMRNGVGYYKACLRYHTTLDITPDEAHVTGLDEVERISKEINKIKKRLHFPGDIPSFLTHIQYYTTITTAQQIQSVEHLLLAINDTVLQDVFYKIVKPEVTLFPVEDKTDLSLGSYRGNVFYMNTNPAINRTSLWTIPLVLHEANPGHHFQSSYSYQQKQAKYRQNIIFTGYYTVPFNYPMYTGYIEGWALYAEYLGEEMGLYPSIYNKLGRHLSDMLRACRLVVDTGIHAFGWSREQGIEYIHNYTGNDMLQSENEVDAIITWPGRACAYKIGEMKIMQLRRQAERMLGPIFDLKKFHDIILRKGPVSLRILEDIVQEWIDDVVHSNASNGIWTITSCTCSLCFNIVMLLIVI